MQVAYFCILKDDSLPKTPNVLALLLGGPPLRLPDGREGTEGREGRHRTWMGDCEENTRESIREKRKCVHIVAYGACKFIRYSFICLQCEHLFHN